MKKLIIAILVGLVAVGMLATGVVFAQGSQPTPTPQLTQTPTAPGHGVDRHHDGPLRTYFEQALAQKLNLTDAQLQEKLTAGKTLYDIVHESGVAEADIPALLDEVHKTAAANAVAAGVITQAQADEMLQHQHGGMMGKHADGPIHTYLDQALAQKLNLTEAQLQEKLTAGKTPYQIVQETGVAEADIPALLQEVHKTALANAVAAGVITQAQADEMLQHIQDHLNNPGGPHGPGMGGGHGHGAHP